MSECLRSLPLVYSCSGCSSAAQMANYMAIQLGKVLTSPLAQKHTILNY
ncbi:hypothetical protein I6G90_09245 [Aeromonas allosaccharophila]|uniref:Uncharacterized protein n=1 Tax=Aeromonas allosaccharophila TaxID=656 RepID=A0A7T2PJ50_9GAMM|nr:putative zinc-binding protein [Aeromonas allosaccharophila]QPR56552.1 hypothetical protein I6G90_09245 [Aeromonas allosaccharophila]